MTETLTAPTRLTAQFREGEEISLLQPIRGSYIGNGGYGSATLTNDYPVTIRKVNKDTLWLRGQTQLSEEYTIVFRVTPESIERYLRPLDPNAPRPRKLGEVPEGMIPADDPRLGWLWEDAAAFANKKGYCSQYDALCDALGIPGRERQFTVKREVNGFNISRSFQARSKKHAEEMFDAELKAALG